MLTRLVLGGGAALVFAGAAFAQGPGGAHALALAGYQSMATSSPQDIGEFARSAKGQIINILPNPDSIAMSQSWPRGTGYLERETPAAQGLPPGQ